MKLQCHDWMLQTAEAVSSLASAGAKTWYLHLSACFPTFLILSSVPFLQDQWLHDSLAIALGLHQYYGLITYRERVVNIRSCFLKKFIHLQQKVKCLSKPREHYGRGTLISPAESTERSSGATAASRCLWSRLSKQELICNWVNWEKPLTAGRCYCVCFQKHSEVPQWGTTAAPSHL